MIRTGEEYRESIRDGREVWICGERVSDVPSHPAFKPIVDARARIYDMAHEDATRDIMTRRDAESGEVCCTANRPPRTQQDWADKDRAVEAVMDELGGVVIRVGDETVGEMWSLYDGADILNEIDGRFAENIARHVREAALADPFHVSANTDPKGDRSKPPQEQDPDMLLHVVRETDAGLVVRGAKFETASAYANQAFAKPTIAQWRENEKLSDYAVGFIARMGAKGTRHICRAPLAPAGGDGADFPIASKFDEVDSLIVFDNVLVPWEDVLFYRHTKAAAFIRSALHRYSAYPFVQRIRRMADMMIGAALHNARQTGLQNNPSVREKLSLLACYREGIHAHLTASVALAEESPGGLLMPNQSMLYAGRVHACSRLPKMMHIARELCGGQICLTPDRATFAAAGPGEWLEKYYKVNEDWDAEDRRRLLAFARDLLNSSYGGHRVTFELFAQSPPFAHLNALYNNFDFAGPLDLVRRAAGLSEKTAGKPQGEKQ